MWVRKNEGRLPNLKELVFLVSGYTVAGRGVWAFGVPRDVESTTLVEVGREVWGAGKVLPTGNRGRARFVVVVRGLVGFNLEGLLGDKPGLFLDCIGDLVGLLLFVIPVVFTGFSFGELVEFFLRTPAGEFAPVVSSDCFGDDTGVTLFFPELLGGRESFGISGGE